jgi:aminoglycoside 6'-N-acetyltransferase I
MQIDIGPVTQHDREEWANMRYELWPDCPPERHALEIEQTLASPGIVAIAHADGKCAGFAEVSIRADHVEGTSISPVPYLEGWYVRPGYRSGGIGSKLVRFVETWALDRGFAELASDTEPENETSIAIHGKLGFREVGRSVHFVKRLTA